MVCVVVPPRPVTVMVWVPVRALRLTRIVIVEVPAPGAAIEAGLKLMETPSPSPEAESRIELLKPPLTAVVMVEVPVPEPLREMLTEAGEALMVKFGFPPELVTVSETVVVSTVLPEVPVTVIV